MTRRDDARLPEAVRQFARIAGPDPRLMARLDDITAEARADMGPERYEKLAREW